MIPLHEILHTILGEGRLTGQRCAIVRTYGCNLRCSWCDTPQENVKPKELSVDEITGIVEKTSAGVVLVTGGEPLMHPDAALLCSKLLEKDSRVILETNGSLDLSVIPRGVIKIMDLKPPSSGHEGSSNLDNLVLLDGKDEIKIVIAGREDYVWAGETIRKHLAHFPGTVNLSPLASGDLPLNVAKWIIEDRLQVRYNLQLHKIIFPAGENAIF